jgi:hypothetical protein
MRRRLLQPLKPTTSRMAMKVDVATAAVAKIANKTLKLLCMVSIRVHTKKLLIQSLRPRLVKGARDVTQ